MASSLTDQQKSFFDTFGYLAFPGLLDDRIDEITSEFEALFASRGGGHNGRAHDGSERSCIPQFIELRERLAALLDDPRIVGVFSELLGEDFNYMGSDGNYYVGDTGWHSDGWSRDHLRIKMALYLDPLTRDSGALRVIPGSHRIGDRYADALQDLVGRSQERLGVHGRDVPAVALETRPGDVVIFNMATKHAAYGGGARRRMFTINCGRRFRDDQIDLLREYISHGARFWLDRFYAEPVLRTASPARMRHLEQIHSNDGHLAALAAEARQRMAEPSRG